MATLKRSKKRLSARKVREYDLLADKIEREEKGEIVATLREEAARHDRLRETVRVLKEERVRQGLTLDEVGRSSGIGKANLSKLENAEDPNPTVGTLMRYAEALGRDIFIRLSGRRRRAG